MRALDLGQPGVEVAADAPARPQRAQNRTAPTRRRRDAATHSGDGSREGCRKRPELEPRDLPSRRRAAGDRAESRVECGRRVA
jgi:hypothetical protein